MAFETLDTTRTQTITGFFDTKAAADQARADLIGAGFSSDAIQIAGGQSADGAPVEEKGFWASLKDFFVPDEQRYSYEEGMRRGGYLLTLSAPESEHERALEILTREGTIDMREREATWRTEGWNGYPGGLAAQGVDNTITSMPDAPLAGMDVDRTRREAEADHRPMEPAFRKPGAIDHVNPVTEGSDVRSLAAEDVKYGKPSDSYRQEAPLDKETAGREEIRLRKNMDELHQTIADADADILDERGNVIRRQERPSSPSLHH